MKIVTTQNDAQAHSLSLPYTPINYVDTKCKLFIRIKYYRIIQDFVFGQYFNINILIF